MLTINYPPELFYLKKFFSLHFSHYNPLPALENQNNSDLFFKIKKANYENKTLHV